MRIFCARHLHLGLVAALRRYPELHNEPVIVAGAPELRLPVLAASAAAVTAGVQPGMPLRQAQQLCREAAFVALDVEAVAALRAAVDEVLQRLSPVVEVADEVVYCDLSGRHARFGDEAAWATALARALHGVLGPEPPAAGIAGSRFAARMAAACSGPARIRRVPPGGDAAFVAQLPLSVLPVASTITARLAAFGLDCLGALAAIAPADLQRQFGRDGLRLAQLARGDDGESVHGEPPPRTLSQRLVLDGPVADLEAIAAAVRHCAVEVGRQLAVLGLAAAVLRLRLETEDGMPVSTAVTAPSPVGCADSAWTVALGGLGELSLSAPVTAVEVEAASLAAAAARQSRLWRAGDAAHDEVIAAAGRLQARFGADTVRRPRLAADPGDLPERRFVWDTPALSGARR